MQIFHGVAESVEFKKKIEVKTTKGFPRTANCGDKIKSLMKKIRKFHLQNLIFVNFFSFPTHSNLSFNNALNSY